MKSKRINYGISVRTKMSFLVLGGRIINLFYNIIMLFFTIFAIPFMVFSQRHLDCWDDMLWKDLKDIDDDN